MACIPPELLQPPELPWPGLTWYCPIKSCDYEIDLLSLTEEQSNSLSVEDVIYMTTIEWSLADELLQQIFMDLTDFHNRWHLDSEGIVLIEDDNGEVRISFSTIVTLILTISRLVLSNGRHPRPIRVRHMRQNTRGMAPATRLSNKRLESNYNFKIRNCTVFTRIQHDSLLYQYMTEVSLRVIVLE